MTTTSPPSRSALPRTARLAPVPVPQYVGASPCSSAVHAERRNAERHRLGFAPLPARGRHRAEGPAR